MVKFDLNQARMTPTKKPKGKGEHGAGWGVWVTLNRVPLKVQRLLAPNQQTFYPQVPVKSFNRALYYRVHVFMRIVFFVLRRTTVNGSMLNYRCIVFVKFNKYALIHSSLWFHLYFHPKSNFSGFLSVSDLA